MVRLPIICFLVTLTFDKGCSRNLSCYQCIRYDNEECAADELVACSPNYDRCVTHIERGEKHGYMVKRECGLGPCAFEDDMVNRGLGLDDCDRSKFELFCVSCCRTTGCNKNSASFCTISCITFFSMFFLLLYRI